MKILIVDDAQETRESLFMIIKAKIDERYEITEAKNGIEALEVIKRFQPDIVLTDIMMPEMDGFELTKILKRHIFTAAITGLSAKEHTKRMIKLSKDNYGILELLGNNIVERELFPKKVNKRTIIFNEDNLPNDF